jgi:hypothetical protein
MSAKILSFFETKKTVFKGKDKMVYFTSEERKKRKEKNPE